ncbi:12952_t:CDS:2 [Cetraspora pellucida]|uniref:12952_t:CDS:1 n=1 Tax=Cetraspora pellucida TaxID=1433469 RepID=A0A9N9FRU2_9GLOM|nr:12952_t:CDS:2 [Cetraspora pellucida]
MNKLPFETIFRIFDFLDNKSMLYFALSCSFYKRRFDEYIFPQVKRDVWVRHTVNYSIYPQELKATTIYLPKTKKAKRSFVEFSGDQLPCDGCIKKKRHGWCDFKKRCEHCILDGIKCVCTSKSIRKPLSRDGKENYYCVSPYNRGEKLIAVRKWEVGTRQCDKCNFYKKCGQMPVFSECNIPSCNLYFKDEKELEEQKQFNDFELYQMIQPKQPKQPDFNIPNKNDFSQVEVIFDMEDIRINKPPLLDNSFSELRRLLTDMNNEMLLNNLANNDFWDYAIKQKLLNGNYAINWNSLSSNYKMMTHLYKEALYYRKMMEQVPDDPQMDFEYTKKLQDTNELLPFVSRDTIVKTLNKVKETFNLMYQTFRSATDLRRAKELYILWNTNIDRTFIDDNFFQYKTKTSQYLAMLFAEWINHNVESGTNIDLLNDIPESIVGSRRRREDDSSNDDQQRPKRCPRTN